MPLRTAELFRYISGVCTGVVGKIYWYCIKRHPREKLFIATKLSNFSNYSRENSIAMYRKSFEDLQTDYIDYYLLHSIGNGGIEAFKARYIDNV